MDKTPADWLREAIQAANGQTALAALISTEILPVGQSHVSMWLARGNVPAEYCPAIERETGVRCEDLNPKVDWAFLRDSIGKAA
jgi:DNA-binding transcriptional regulator YdaS (Cro superfamily)